MSRDTTTPAVAPAGTAPAGTAARPKRPRGICCPRCPAVRLLTVRTIQRADGSTERRRRCPTCGLVRTTFERVQAGAGSGRGAA
jgi:hypothetical protein